MKKLAVGISLCAALVLLSLSLMNTGAAGTYAPSPGHHSASLLANCTPPPYAMLQPPYSSSYVACSLGSFSGLPAGIGAIAFKHGDPNTLLVATYLETPPAMIYSVPVQRDGSGHIIAISPGGTLFADAPYLGTGMAYGPGNVLFYSRSPINELGEIKPGSTETGRVIGLTTLGVTPSISGLNFVPSGFAHQGELKLVTFQHGNWYAATLSAQADGTYSIATIAKKATILSYPESFVYVPPSSPGFSDYSAVLMGEYYENAVAAYSLDSESNPVSTSRTSFLTGAGYVEGTAIDPVTEDLIVTNRAGDVVAVRGFGTEPVTPTPTPTSPPTSTYSISGRVTTSDNQAVGNVRIDAGEQTAFTDAAGYYTISGLAEGNYYVTAAKTDYLLQPSGKFVSVPPDATLNFVARLQSRNPPVILLHDFYGLPSNPTDKCTNGVEHWNAQLRWFGDFPQWLADDGFDVWIGHWDSAPWPGVTSSFEDNGRCLAKEIATVKQLTNQSKVILIAHGMGGQVSRAYLQSSAYALRRDVQTLITLGSPHGGINAIGILASLFPQPIGVFCTAQPAFCQVTPSYMMLFNGRSETNSASYYLIGGDEGNLVGTILSLTEGPNDGLVGVASATGRYYSLFGTQQALSHSSRQYRTHESHSFEGGTSYFEAGPGETFSQSYKCVREILLGLPRTECAAAPTAAEQVLEEAAYSAFAPWQRGHISTGQTINRTFSIDTAGRSIFALTWITQTLSLTLLSPDGTRIDPTYAMSHPSIVTFQTGPAGNGSAGWMSYAFATTLPGNWTLSVSAPYAGPDGSDWTMMAAFESSRTLEAGTGAELYGIGEAATLTATLKSGQRGIAGATVRVELARSDSVTDTLTLAHVGGGHYRATYTVPNAPGYVDVIFSANGSDGGVVFSRQSRQLLSIMPQTGQLTGSYADRATDENGDRRPDALQVDVGLNISKAGSYNLAADLQVGGQRVAQSSKVISVTAGIQIVTLRFDGGDIYNAGLNGPYLLTNLVLVDLSAAVPAIMQSNLYTTGPYNYADFQPRSLLYLPVITR